MEAICRIEGTLYILLLLVYLWRTMCGGNMYCRVLSQIRIIKIGIPPTRQEIKHKYQEKRKGRGNMWH
jgi:hypothetical protein